MFLSKLPHELILAVANNLPIVSLSRLLRTCKSLQGLLGPELTTRITTEQLASTILRRGIQRNDLPTVNLALAHNAPWHTYEDSTCYSAIDEACDRNRLDIVAALITHYGASILTDNDAPDGTYCHATPLETALRSGNLELTTLLLEHGAPANRTKWYGYPSSDKEPLDFAAKYGSADIAEVLIRHGADVRYAGRSLSYAVRSGIWGVVKVLLRHGVFVWEPKFEWSGRFPLGSRSPEEIDAWVAGGIEYMKRCEEEDIAWTVAARESMGGKASEFASGAA